MLDESTANSLNVQRRLGEHQRRDRPTGAEGQASSVIRIAISAAAFPAIRDSHPVGTRRYESQKAVGGLYLVSVPDDTIDKLEALPGPSESLSDVHHPTCDCGGRLTVTRPFSVLAPRSLRGRTSRRSDPRCP